MSQHPSVRDFIVAPPHFTPGPWVEHSHRQIGPKLGGVVCEVWSAIGDTDDNAIDQADANCRLIKAAPAMYDALLWALVAVDNENRRGVYNHVLAAIRAALSAVEGGE